MGTEFISRTYKFPQETLDQLQALDEKIKGKTKRDIIVEAISMMAAEHGVGERGEDSLSLDKLKQQLDAQGKTIKLLCKTCVKYEFAETEEKMDLDKMDKLIAKTKKASPGIEPKEVWTAVKKSLPEALKDSANFKLYLATKD